MRQVQCINDIYDAVYNYKHPDLLFVKKGIFNITLDNPGPFNHIITPSKNNIDQIINNYNSIESKYTDRIDDLYRIFIPNEINKGHSLTIDFSTFVEILKVFRNVKRTSFNKQITQRQIEKFIKIISLIPDRYMYKEVVILKTSFSLKLRDFKIHDFENDDLEIKYNFKLHNKFHINDLRKLISYFLTFTTLNRFDALIKTNAIMKL